MQIHIDTTGESRNPIGSLADLDMAICVYGWAKIYKDEEVVYRKQWV